MKKCLEKATIDDVDAVFSVLYQKRNNIPIKNLDGKDGCDALRNTIREILNSDQQKSLKLISQNKLIGCALISKSKIDEFMGDEVWDLRYIAVIEKRHNFLSTVINYLKSEKICIRAEVLKCNQSDMVTLLENNGFTIRKIENDKTHLEFNAQRRPS